MAGNIENSTYTINFQADPLHSGSISFGRFENESLCWERRSSFSHNRYLEDAEKYSRPGSVNEKKAYFEAHFRRRALMKQASSISQNGTDYQSSENDFSETMSYEYDNFGSFRERSHSAHFEYLVSGTVFEEPCSATERGTPYDDQNELQFIRPNSECDTPICDLENMQELQHDEVGNVNLMTNESETENLNTEVEKLDMSSKASSVSSNRHLVEGDNSVNTDHQTTAMIFDIVDLSARHPHDETVTTLSSEHEDDASSKEMAATSRPREKKSQPDGMKSGRTVVSTQGRRASSNVESRKAAENVSSKNFIGKHTKKEANELLRLKREKRAAESASPTTKPNYHNRVKQEVPQNSKTKPLHLNRSMDLDSRTKRTVNPLRPSYGNVAAKLNSNVNRPRQAFGSSRTGIKQNDSAFSFKSDERMVKRKEFLIKQDEKIHTKEAEMHQLQSKKEEKIEAENKQLRKRLNFKSTPIPSFYHDFHHGIIKSKGTPSNMKESTPVRRISMSETCERSPSFSEAKSERAPSSGEPLNKTRLQRDIEVTSFHRAARPQSSHYAAPGCRTQAGTANPLITKKMQGNEKHQRSPSCSIAGRERTPSAGITLNKAPLQHDQEVTSFHQASRPKSSHSAAPGCRKLASTANPSITKKMQANEKHQRSPSCSMAGSERTPSSCKPLNKTPLQRDQEVTSFLRAARPKSSHSAAPGCRTRASTANPLTTKKKRGNKKDQSTQRNDFISIDKVNNETMKDADQQKLNSNRSSTRVVRKDMRGGAGFGGSARFSHLTVDIAS